MKKHHTKEKGDLGLQAVIFECTKQEYKCFTSNSEHLPFDFIAYKNNKYYRIQAKYRSSKDGMSITLNSRTSYSDANGYHTHPYDKDEIDVFAIYCPETEKVYFINPKCFDKSINIRLEKPKNNQIRGIHNADDFLMLDSVETTRDTPEMVKI